MADVLSVSALNRYVKNLLDRDDFLFDLALRGEVANFVRNSKSGHCYFSLRDDASSVKAVMFRSDAQRLAFRPEEGMRVVVRCRVTLYERDGAFQVYVSDMFPDGIGSAQLALEQLKQKLYAEGIFAPEHKKKIPACPACIGVVTSKTGAALQDIRNVLSRRWPLAKVLLCPVSVQGFEASAQIARAIGRLDADGRPDVILVARGGGSREDLWVFNAENIVRAAYRCRVPIISAIGHEIDTTLLDYVADLRAPTPSAAAELAVPDRAAVRQEICKKAEDIQSIMQFRMQVCYNGQDDIHEALLQYPCRQRTARMQAALAAQCGRIQAAAAACMQAKQTRFAHDAALTESLSPYRTLSRGYAMLADAKGNVVAAEQLRAGEDISVRGLHRTASCHVVTVEDNQDEKSQEL